MHELSLAQSLLDQIVDLAGEHKAQQVNRAVVTLGPFSGVVRESFEFGFTILKKDRAMTRGCILELETPDPEYTCLDCGKLAVIPFPQQSDRLELARCGLSAKKCPWCDSKRISPKGGTELILNQLEME